MALSVVSKTKGVLGKIEKMGGGGIVGGVLVTLALEFGTQFLRKIIPSEGKRILDQRLVSNSPFLGAVTVRDGIVLSPTVTGILSVLKGHKKVGLGLMIGNYGTKIMLRRSGFNPGLLDAPTTGGSVNRVNIQTFQPPLG